MNLEESYIMIEESEEEGETFFFDTYAFYEIYGGNENYKKYEGCRIITTKLNIFEIYLIILRDYGEEDAEKIFNNYYEFVKDFDKEIIKNAAKMKKELNRRDLSMTDCIGYCLAKQLGIKFLTGDKQFKDMENVEFVK